MIAKSNVPSVLQSINPATGEFIAHYESLSESETDSKLNTAYQAYQSWRELPYSHRAQKMRAAVAVLTEGKKRYAHIITQEMGKPIRQAIGEVEKCVGVCNYYAKNAERFLRSRDEPSDADQSYVRYDPIGPVLAVMPWNYPFWQVFRFAAPSLMAGNVGVLKHASNVPGAALAIEEVFHKAGFPEGAFTTLLVSSKSVAGIIEDPRIAAVTLTGSTPAGQKVAATAGGVLKKSVLELGGSDPCIILPDADIDKAAQTAALSRTMNAGQSCIAAKRFIVHKEVAHQFIAAFKNALEALIMGDPTDEKTDIGPLARLDLREELHDQVTRTLAQGATLLLGGKIPSGPGAFYPVTLLTDVTPDMAAAKEETFGPIAPVIVVDSTDDAIALANASEFGLGASLWTADLDNAQQIARRIESGAVYINGMVKSDPRLPFGGIKQSGYGRELSREGIREFTNPKTIWISK